MSSSSDASALEDKSPPTTRRALLEAASTSTRKAPPSPLALLSSSSSSSPSSFSNIPSKTTSTSVSPNARNSLESSRSDWTSASALTSLCVSEFPIPPSALPPIPASPATPRSLYFSTTPSTPRSHSPHSLFQPDPPPSPVRSLLGRPISLKGIFSGTRSQSPQHSHPKGSGRSEPHTLQSSDADSKLPRPIQSSQDTIYKDSDDGQSQMPTTAGTIIPQDWASGSGRTSPLPPPRLAYVKQPRSQSPLRAASSFTEQQESHTVPHPEERARTQSTFSHLQRPISPQPPRSPLPVPPSRRYSDSLRSSGRYSHIARKAGITDMGVDISEEELLSSEFISEMLKQPASSSPHFARSLRLPDSPRSTFSSEDTHGLSGHIRGSEMRLASDPYADLASPGAVPKSVSDDMASLDIPRKEDGSPTSYHSTSNNADGQLRSHVLSGIASSTFPSGGDKVYFEDHSPIHGSFLVPGQMQRVHSNLHPLMPSTPQTADSLASPPPSGISRGFAQAQMFLPGWRKSSSVITRLPIGPPSPSGNSKSGKPTSPRLMSPKVRQHRYPRQSTFKPGQQKKEDVGLPSSPSAASNASTTEDSRASRAETASPSVTSNVHILGSAIKEGEAEQSAQTKSVARRAVRSHALSAVSNTSSTRTQRDSLTTFRTMESHTFSDEPSQSSEQGLSETRGESRRSYVSNFLSGEESDDESNYIEGEVQTAVLNTATTTSPKAGNATVVGMAPAVIIRQKSLKQPSDVVVQEIQEPQHLDAKSPTSGFEPETSAPPSPREPPSIHTPPSHHADIPESAKSFLLSEDNHDTKTATYLPHDEASYGFSNTFWNMNYGSLNVPPQGSSLKRGASNNAGSFKSIVSYITSKSKISHKSNHSVYSNPWTWLMRKPLPPLPSAETGDSVTMLEQRQFKRSNVSLVPGEPQGWKDTTIDEKWSPPVTKPSLHQRNAWSETQESSHNTGNSRVSEHPGRAAGRLAMWIRNPKVRFWLPIMGVLFLVIILGAALGASLGGKHQSGASSACNGNKTGVQCNLNATCTCPSPQSGTGFCSAPLAQELNSLIPVVSQLFETNITAQAMALTLWELQGTPTSSNCAPQAELVDVGSVLDGSSLPNRTQWAQSALLWSLFQSGDIPASKTMQSAIEKLPFHSLAGKDGVQADPSNTFAISSLGFTYNFANQTAVPPSLNFKVDASPSSQQLSEINGVAESSLDRMYSYASASSTQRQTALSTYWQSVLLLSDDDLPSFLAAFKSASVLLPFDATNQGISDLLAAAVNKTLTFPPSIACYPGLSASQIARISLVENQVYGLAPLNASAATFDTTCFGNRPIYGVLDVMRTRLPFSDSRSGVAKQAAVLTSDAASRAVLHVGELLSALPGPNITDISPFDVNPRDFGTLSHLNHIALEWLQSFPTPTLAADAAKFVASSPTVPPASGSSLFNSTSVPIIEVALFGNVFLSDISLFVSSFATPSGALFFGSSQGQTFRRWALQQSSTATIAWSEDVFASQVVLEGSSTNGTFEQIWTNAGTLAAGPTNASSVGNIVNQLSNAGLFST
ncbi:hypothetical protein K439DRAFT_1610779 [Ramaria rubella]|nr:hypothetical protein K439DRAFT_1610779 [Ramaria rubella]